MLGYQAEELLGHPSHHLWHHTKADGAPYPKKECAIYVALNDGKVHRSSDEVFWRKDGTSFPVEYASTPIYEDGRVTGAVVTFSDITDRKLAENERRIVYEIIQGSITTPNLDQFLALVHRLISQVVYAENCYVMLHDPTNDTIHFEFWVDKRDPPPPPKPFGTGFASHVLRTGVPSLLTEESKRKLQERGEAEQIGSSSASWLGAPLRTPSRTIGVIVLQHYEDENAYSQRDLEFLSSVADQIALAIERKRAEEELGESEERYRDLVENALDIIYTHDFEGNCTSANKAVEDVLGYTIKEAVSKNMANMVVPEDMEKAGQMMADLHAGKAATVTELEVFTKDGHRVALEVNARLMEENGVPVGIQGVARDITARKHLEEQFLQSQKMEGIGMLAGGIAHDFNNLLTAILGFSELTLKRMPAHDPFRPNIEEIKEAGKRAASLTGQLLAFSRKQILKPAVHNVNTVVENLEKMLRRIIRENIELKTVLDPELGNINADPVQIEQVIMNLAVNARDAMPTSGTLTIETQNVYYDAEDAGTSFTLDPGPYVKMVFTDTGEGMDEQTRQRIFEPFFTTKAVGRGTGLGLSTVHGIVKQSRGDIAVYSKIGHGTTFEIYFPRVDEPVKKPKWIEDLGGRFHGTETILLVEDEEIVRNLVCEILTSNGYNVLEASSGKAALSICDTFSEPIHMLLTDVIMPNMSGGQVADLVMKMRPEIKVLYISGYADDSITHAVFYDSDTAFLEKPFTPDGIARKVRAVLNSN
jgi:PAS domain S-box-containing protein